MYYTPVNSKLRDFGCYFKVYHDPGTHQETECKSAFTSCNYPRVVLSANPIHNEKNLGIGFDSKLSFAYHAERIYNNANKASGFLIRNRTFMNIRVITTHTRALEALWNTALTSESFRSKERTQKLLRYLRYMPTGPSVSNINIFDKINKACCFRFH